MNPAAPQTLRVVDSHTAGEPTRTVISGFPALSSGTLQERARDLSARFGPLLRAMVAEPRGSGPMVGALLLEPDGAPVIDGADIAVVFFNDVGLLGMCGHGTIGVVATLAHMGRLAPGTVRVQTIAGIVSATLDDTGNVTIANVPSRRTRASVRVEVPGHRPVSGDVAYGGNWFFLCADHGLAVDLANIDALTRVGRAIRKALAESRVTGDGGAEIDHVELLSPALDPANHGRAFVLCPGGAYDRSPCGTGTSAKIACLAADGKLAAGKVWRQESVIGSVFEAWYEESPGGGRVDQSVRPKIRGRAFVTAEATLVLDPRDPFVHGIR